MDDSSRQHDEAAAVSQLASLQSVLMQAPAAIAILRGPHHVVELSNVAMAAAWGRSPNESLGRPLFEAIPAARRFQPVLDGVFSSGRPHEEQEMPFRIERQPDGTEVPRYANVLFAPLRGPAGGVDGIFVIAVDITDSVRNRQEMQRLRAVAEAASHAKDQFLAMLGHELRNPLAPITTAIELLHLRGLGGREVEIIERQVAHLTRLVDDLLDVSRAIRGKIEIHPRAIELAEVVSEALEQTTPLLEQRQDVIEVDVPGHGLAVHADPARMVQAISNLLTNAAKYSDRRSVIRVRGERTGGKVRLSVRDPGIGIAPEMLDRIFDLFVQGDQTIERARGGLGLGLPIVRSLVELHGGSVWASSEGPGRGSEFTIELPALAQDRPPTSEAGASQLERATAHGRILVVDDNQDAAALLGEALAHLGYEIAVAHDGPSALRVSAAFDPDLALVDIGLPVMNGYELAGHLREQHGHRDRPHLVAVTGYGEPADRQQSARAGFERHLVKPVDLATLSQTVAELVPRPARG